MSHLSNSGQNIHEAEAYNACTYNVVRVVKQQQFTESKPCCCLLADTPLTSDLAPIKAGGLKLENGMRIRWVVTCSLQAGRHCCVLTAVFDCGGRKAYGYLERQAIYSSASIRFPSCFVIKILVSHQCHQRHAQTLPYAKRTLVVYGYAVSHI
eukprot:6176492-Pleurochrysis_carterae.AAC.1